jgi:DHA1 family bicyclomycin/chloramphenicol resistance-like MFS transporter
MLPPGFKMGGVTFVLAALSWIGPFSIDTYLPSLPHISVSLNASEAQAQQTMTAFLVFFALMSLWHGAISDAYGRRRFTMIALVVFSLASVGCALSGSVGTLMVFRALQGASAGAGMIVGRAIVRDLFEGAAAQRLMSHVATIFTIAPVLAPVIGGWLQVWFGWRSVFYFLVIVATFLFLSCHRFLPETLPRDHRQPLRSLYLARSYWKVMTLPAFLLACGSMAFMNAAFFIYIMGAPTFLMKHLKLSETEFLWLFGPVSAAMVIGAWLSGHYAGKISRKRTIVYSLIIMTVAASANVLLNWLFPPVLPWPIVPLFVYVLGMAMAMPSVTLLALDLFPMQRGLAASCQGFLSIGANSVISAFVPLVWGTTLSLAWTMAWMMAVGGAMVLQYFRLVPRAKEA